jgi:hypothetical protein
MTSDANAALRAHIEQGALKFCKEHYGTKGLKLAQEIDSKISWRPNFHLRKGVIILAVEVSEVLDSTIFKIVSSEILNFTRPVALYLACPLRMFQTDVDGVKVKELRKLGVGIITINDRGNAVLQVACVPLAQHISEETLTHRIRELPQRLKVAFRDAHDTFSVDPGQGLQKAGQIVEALVDCMAAGAVKKGTVTATAISGGAADKIDGLWSPLKPHRASLGGARSFLKTYRNIASHPASSAKEAMTKINGCRDGFFQAISLARDLSRGIHALGYQLRLHVT